MRRYHDLVDRLIADGVLRTPSIIEAFRVVDRRDFVPDNLKEDAYLNVPLPIGGGQTISQPYTVAFMLELLQPKAGHNILDVGSGSGWQTALLAQVVGEAGHVTAIEIIPSLCQMGVENVGKYGFFDKGIVEMHCMSGLNGYPEQAPFDRLIAAAALPSRVGSSQPGAGRMIPGAWLDQVKINGQIVLPIGSSLWQWRRLSETEWEHNEFPGFAFVPFVGD